MVEEFEARTISLQLRQPRLREYSANGRDW
jgi:hypothetical protein